MSFVTPSSGRYRYLPSFSRSGSRASGRTGLMLLPVFAVLGAGVAALVEWQGDDGPDKPDDDRWSEALDA